MVLPEAAVLGLSQLIKILKNKKKERLSFHPLAITEVSSYIEEKGH